MNLYDDLDEYAEFEALLDDNHTTRPPRPRKKPRPKPGQVRAQLTDLRDDVADFVPTYARTLDPQHHERQWVIDSIAPFYREQVITDVIRRVKAGKEANVYLCLPHPATEVALVAAKLYRPRILRTLKNDAIYKAGRQLRNEEGKQLKGRREKLALSQKTRFGRELDTAWWINNEYEAQLKLFEAGADVPRPLRHSGNTILMEYIGDERVAAPALIDLRLPADEARELLFRILANVRLMLDHHLVHGDLSAYNILYWQGDIRIIDFPQMVDARSNPFAAELLQRDVVRVCEHFTRYGQEIDGRLYAADLWRQYMG